MMKTAGSVLAGVLFAGAALPVQAQVQPAPGIYSCIDAKGRRLTSDRPIAECLDREQQILNPSGTVRTIVPPSYTAREREQLELRQRREADERARQQEERRRERALLLRYPNQAVHDKERAEALNSIAVVRQAAVNRVLELMRQRRELDKELEFYAGDPSRVPAFLRRLVEENERSLGVQERFIAEQDAETGRVNARFDEELQRLRPLWALAQPSAQ